LVANRPLHRNGIDVTEMPLQSPGRGEAALDVLRRTARFCDEKLGWNRIGFLLSLTIIGIAVMALVHILRHIKVEKVLEAMLAAHTSDIVWASVFVAGGYFTLTFYDLFALRTIRWAKIPYRVAMLASFTSYSIGHNVGASVLTGGAVRYRIYSTWGLDAIAVTKLCFVAGLTFWLGNATVLGLGIAYVPDAASAIDQLPTWFNRGLAFVILTVLASYIVWVWQRPRVIGRQGWKVTLPDGPLTLLQIGIGIVDLACCALAMFMLLPLEPNIGFVTLAVIFVAATLLGFASHAPGGIGVFDAAMLVALWQFDKQKLLAGLLLFRLLYYVVPFVLSVLILGGRELLLGLPRRTGVPPPPAAGRGPDRAAGEDTQPR
jgi:glycosyltransferase 2 family protein